ncbi:MAG: 50S ribosomal protein L6 [archaeon]
MKADLTQKMAIPEGVTASVGADNLVEIKGKAGEVKRIFKDARIQVRLEGNEIVLTSAQATKREKMRLNTYRAHILNMMRGVIENHVYALKVCSGHFPMNVALQGDKLSVKNFIGEKIARTLKIHKDAKVTVDGDIIGVTSASKEVAGMVAGAIERLCKRPGFDKRIFQDGIYITKKDGKSIV